MTDLTRINALEARLVILETALASLLHHQQSGQLSYALPVPPSNHLDTILQEARKLPREAQGFYVLSKTEDAFGLKPGVLLGPRRHRAVTFPRSAVYWRLQQLGWTLMQIAKFVGRHHTSVLQGARAYEKHIQNLGFDLDQDHQNL